MTSELVEKNKKRIVNAIFPLEDIQLIINYFSKYLLIPDFEFKQREYTQHTTKYYSFYYTPELVDIVSRLFEIDIKIGKYKCTTVRNSSNQVPKPGVFKQTNTSLDVPLLLV